VTLSPSLALAFGFARERGVPGDPTLGGRLVESLSPVGRGGTADGTDALAVVPFRPIERVWAREVCRIRSSALA
jgi:hypothetical protein